MEEHYLEVFYAFYSHTYWKLNIKYVFFLASSLCVGGTAIPVSGSPIGTYNASDILDGQNCSTSGMKGIALFLLPFSNGY
jgi:hypothetical protein